MRIDETARRVNLSEYVAFSSTPVNRRDGGHCGINRKIVRPVMHNRFYNLIHNQQRYLMMQPTTVCISFKLL